MASHLHYDFLQFGIQQASWKTILAYGYASSPLYRCAGPLLQPVPTPRSGPSPPLHGAASEETLCSPDSEFEPGPHKTSPHGISGHCAPQLHRSSRQALTAPQNAPSASSASAYYTAPPPTAGCAVPRASPTSFGPIDRHLPPQRRAQELRQRQRSASTRAPDDPRPPSPSLLARPISRRRNVARECSTYRIELVGVLLLPECPNSECLPVREPKEFVSDGVPGTCDNNDVVTWPTLTLLP
jgi:hypothetical protein